MTEYIKREDALEFPFANGIYDHEHANEHFIFGCESYREWIASIPAADVVERKTGKWINYLEDGFVECPFCKSATNCDGDIAELHYCFNCGAKLEGDEDA